MGTLQDREGREEGKRVKNVLLWLKYVTQTQQIQPDKRLVHKVGGAD